MRYKPAQIKDDFPEFRASSELLKLLLALKEGEERSFQPSGADIPHNARFYDITGPSRTSFRYVWENRPGGPAEPYVRVPFLPRLSTRSLAELPEPIIRLEGKFDDRCHLYHFFDTLLVSERLLDCLLDLDGDELEVRQVEARGVPVEMSFFFVLSYRRMDPIDLNRSNLVAEFTRITPESSHFRRVSSMDYVVREDLPLEWHLLDNMFNGSRLWSVNLIDRIRAAGVRGLLFKRTDLARIPLAEAERAYIEIK